MPIVVKSKKQPCAPVVFDEPSLADWLLKHSAKHLWRLATNDKAVEGWAIDGQMFIVVLYAKTGNVGGGWDIFTSCNSLDTDRTLEDAEQRIDNQPKED